MLQPGMLRACRGCSPVCCAQERLVVACGDECDPMLLRYASYGDGEIELAGTSKGIVYGPRGAPPAPPAAEATQAVEATQATQAAEAAEAAEAAAVEATEAGAAQETPAVGGVVTAATAGLVDAVDLVRRLGPRSVGGRRWAWARRLP